MKQAGPEKKSLKERVSSIFKPTSSGKRLVKKNPLPTFQIQEARTNGRPGTGGGSVNSSAYGESGRYLIQNGSTNGDHSSIWGNNAAHEFRRDEQTGELLDSTDVMHSLARQDSQSTTNSALELQRQIFFSPYSEDGGRLMASLSPRIWSEIASYLSLAEIAILAFTSKTLLSIFGTGSWLALDLPENRQEKLDFLLFLDRSLPYHLLCFQCAIYHPRIRPGHEQLRANHLIEPVFKCPQDPPFMRLTPENKLPFPFLQMAVRAERFSPYHGLPFSALTRRWSNRDSNWTYSSRYMIYKNHIILRVISTSFAEADLPPSAQRHLLYCDRDDYTPYFSVCAHWRDGDLMDSCKCALSHIPPPQRNIMQQLKNGPSIQLSVTKASAIVSLCSNCRPIMRCPECPTEYLIEIKLAEDKNDPVNRFKNAIVVTRWSDLGDGRSPMTPEWMACKGETEYDSFAYMKKRGLSGIFEAAVAGIAIPGQIIMSMNPKMRTLGEEGDDWY